MVILVRQDKSEIFYLLEYTARFQTGFSKSVGILGSLESSLSLVFAHKSRFLSFGELNQGRQDESLIFEPLDCIARLKTELIKNVRIFGIFETSLCSVFLQN